MKITADANLKDIEQIFSRYGELQLLPGREINKQSLGNSEVLLVRSVTRVNKDLLEGTNIKFVGTATSGVEHIDQDYLASKGITLAHAKGANAIAVAEYCLSALCFAQAAGNFDFQHSCVGLVGMGCVGGEFARLLLNLNIPVNAYDPLLNESQIARYQNAGVKFCSLEDLFNSTAVSMHVPLTEGKFATQNMVNSGLLSKLSSQGVFINASRGEVVDEADLLELLAAKEKLFTVLDVWHEEPRVNLPLLARADISTAHFAGYSRRAKLKATKLLEQQFVNFLGSLNSRHSASVVVEPDQPLRTSVELSDFSVEAALRAVLRLDKYSAQFKESARSPNALLRSEAFDRLRKSMINRPEYADIALPFDNFSTQDREKLQLLGFQNGNIES